MPDLAIAISVYDRWLELGGLLELLRLNWPADMSLHISVITTADESMFPDWINRDMIDVIEFGSPYPMPWWNGISARMSHNPVVKHYRHRYLSRIIRCRTLDSIKRGCISGMNSGAPFTLHLHAAAWPIFARGVQVVLSEMKLRNAVVACRGYGKNWVDAKRPFGDIDDNFFFIDNNFAKNVKFWDFDPAKDAIAVSNEGRLARRMYSVCDEDRILFFDDFSNQAEYDFPEGADARRVQPYNFHRRLGFLRSHDLTKQAYYCVKYDISGPIISKIRATVS